MAPEPVVLLHPHDDVLVAIEQLVAGMRVGPGELAVRGLIPPGHKVAVRRLEAGSPVLTLRRPAPEDAAPMACGSDGGCTLGSCE